MDNRCVETFGVSLFKGKLEIRHRTIPFNPVAVSAEQLPIAQHVRPTKPKGDVVVQLHHGDGGQVLSTPVAFATLLLRQESVMVRRGFRAHPPSTSLGQIITCFPEEIFMPHRRKNGHFQVYLSRAPLWTKHSDAQISIQWNA